jgi:hypothetical protein
MTTLAITGNTYPVKDSLKALGCRWNGDMKAWVAPTAQIYEQGMRLVVGTPQKSVVRTATARTSAPTKRCWECGCSFSRADANASGGDWNESYCGC